MHLTRILYYYSYRTFIPYVANVNVWRRTENEERDKTRPTTYDLSGSFTNYPCYWSVLSLTIKPTPRSVPRWKFDRNKLPAIKHLEVEITASKSCLRRINKTIDGIIYRTSASTFIIDDHRPACRSRDNTASVNNSSHIV